MNEESIKEMEKIHRENELLKEELAKALQEKNTWKALAMTMQNDRDCIIPV